MKYCSYDARQVVDHLKKHGYEVAEQDYIEIEQAVGKFWPNHIMGVIDGVLKPTSKQTTEQKIDRAKTLGWAYFHKPVFSMLTPRGGAHRTESIDFATDEWTKTVYNIVTTGFVVADFTVKELALLVVEIPALLSTGESHELSYAITAAKRGSRNIFYLNGVIRRETQTKKGKAIERQEQIETDAEKGWSAPEDFELMDVTERLTLASDWQKKQNDILISKGLNSV